MSESYNLRIESHNWKKSCILIGLRSEVFRVELRVENEDKWYCLLFRNDCRQTVTQQLQKSFSYNANGL